MWPFRTHVVDLGAELLNLLAVMVLAPELVCKEYTAWVYRHLSAFAVRGPRGREGKCGYPLLVKVEPHLALSRSVVDPAMG